MMGVDEGNIQFMDAYVKMIMENCPIYIPTVHTYK